MVKFEPVFVNQFIRSKKWIHVDEVRTKVSGSEHSLLSPIVSTPDSNCGWGTHS